MTHPGVRRSWSYRMVCANININIHSILICSIISSAISCLNDGRLPSKAKALVRKERSLRFQLRNARNKEERRIQRNSNDRQRRLLTSSLLEILDELVPSQGNRKKSRTQLLILTNGKCPSIDINLPIGKLIMSFTSSRRDRKKDGNRAS
jgi:hypothetical protein